MDGTEKKHYVTATAIIVKEGKFLIAQRSEKEKAFPNRWTVPGGKLEANDYVQRTPDAGKIWYNVLEDVVRREVKEEVNLEIKEMRYVTSLTFIRPDGLPGLIISFMADYAGGEVVLDPCLTQHAWVTFEEAKSYDLIDGILDELRLADQYLRTGKMAEWKKGTE
jgi:8-oxo-dGTP pyrophosphatase MutT (NUDIX family)